MHHSLNIHIEGLPRLEIASHGGHSWVRLCDESRDHVSIHSDVPVGALMRAVEAFNAALNSPLVAEQPIAAE